MDKKAVVVGGGISGLLAALVLGKNGYKVSLFEKNNFLGGACRSYKVDGYTVDTGPHVFTHLKDGPLAQLMNKYFKLVPNFVEHGEYHIRRADGTLKKLPLDIFEFLSTDIISRRDKPKIAVALTEGITKLMMDPSKLNISLWDYIKKYRLSKNTLRLVDAVAYFLAGVSMKECPAWRFFTGSGFWGDDTKRSGIKDQIARKMGYLKKAMVHDRFPDQGYPKGGIGSIVDALTHSFNDLKVELRTNEEVVRINTDGGSVTGIETSKAEYKADLLIYSAELKKLPDMVDSLPKDFEKTIKTLKSVYAITIWIGFEDPKNFFDYTGSELYYEGRAPFWAMCTSNFDPSLAPKGKKLVGFGSVVRGKNHKRYEKLMMDEIFSVFNGMEERAEMVHVQLLKPEKAAVTVRSRFPGIESGINNLFCVGTDVDMRSMGVTRAAYSVVELAKKLDLQ